jgi:hypothetical protein
MYNKKIDINEGKCSDCSRNYKDCGENIMDKRPVKHPSEVAIK